MKAEQPLLLNPLDPDDEPPSMHLNFVVETDKCKKPNGRHLVGIVWSESARGKQTIDILKLNRDALFVRRGQAINSFLQKLDQEYLKQLNLKSGGLNEACVAALIKQELTSDSEYCAAKLAAAYVWVERWEKRREAERKEFGEVLNEVLAD